MREPSFSSAPAPEIPFEVKLPYLNLVPRSDSFTDPARRRLVADFESLDTDQQFAVLKKMGMTLEAGFTLADQASLDRFATALSEVKFGVLSMEKGRDGLEISTPTGGM